MPPVATLTAPMRARGPAPVTTLDLSIVVVSWNTRDLLRACLESIEAHLGPVTAETIVVDNGSADGSAEMVERVFPRVRLIANADNRGFAVANNQGLRVTRGRYVLLLNPDTVVLDDVLTRTIAFADRHPDAGVVGCQVLEAPDRIQATSFRFPSPWQTLLFATGLSGVCPRSPIAGRATYGAWDRRSERDVDVVSGMFMLVRRAALEDVGPMDEDYFVYAEETDWCHRFRAEGWRCVHAPVGRILHVHGGGNSTGQTNVRMYVQLQKSLLLFHRKRLGPVSWGLSRLIYAVAMPIRTAVWWTRAAVTRDPAARARARHKIHQAAAATRFHWTGRAPDA